MAGTDATGALMQAGLNLIQQALSIYDSDLRLAICNRPFKEIFDLPDWLVTPGASFEDTIRFLVERGEYGPVDDAEDAVRQRVEQARAFEPHYMERRRANGRTISVEGSPLPQGGWVTVYTDITGVKRQEELLRARSEELSDQVLEYAEELSGTNRELQSTIAMLEEAKRELTEMEARTRLTTEMMPAHIAHVDLDGFYTYSNRRLSTVLPTRPSQILGLHISDALGPAAYERIAPYLHRAYQGEASVFEFTDEASSRRIRAAFTPDTRNQAVSGVYLLSMDVTEEAQARAALAQVHKRELAAQLTSGLAHDFSNLLTIILGLQSRLGRMDMPDEAAELIAATTAAARRGGTLLDRLADMSGARMVRPAPTVVAALLTEIDTLASPSLPEEVMLIVACDGLEEPYLLDSGSLQDCLLNLILNARDAMRGHSGRIEVSARAVGDTWLEIIVADTGPGFSAEALEQALNPFYTTKGGEGSGLGLSMVFDLTKMAGGHVRLANTDVGAEVMLRLPLRPASMTSAPCLVLLVEDNPEIRTSVREMLMDHGHQVVEAASAEEAEALAAIEGIGMILSDISLEGPTSGLQLLDRLRRRGVTAPARLMTSLPPSDPRRASAATRYPLIGKPFTPEDLSRFLLSEAAA